jgi:hypothetical protein
MKILMVFTSHDQLGDTGLKTSFWLEEGSLRRLVAFEGLAWPDDFLYLPEVLYVMILVWLIFSGPGRYSLDGLGRAWLQPCRMTPDKHWASAPGGRGQLTEIIYETSSNVTQIESQRSHLAFESAASSGTQFLVSQQRHREMKFTYPERRPL